MLTAYKSGTPEKLPDEWEQKKFEGKEREEREDSVNGTAYESEGGSGAATPSSNG